MLLTSDEQIRFPVQIQRIAIEQGDDSEASLAVSTDAIAEKFVRYCWRRAMPYPAAVGHASSSAEHGTTRRHSKYCPPGAGWSGRFSGCRHEQRSPSEQAC